MAVLESLDGEVHRCRLVLDGGLCFSSHTIPKTLYNDRTNPPNAKQPVLQTDEPDIAEERPLKPQRAQSKSMPKAPSLLPLFYYGLRYIYIYTYIYIYL
jgi:hypothetical protein